MNQRREKVQTAAWNEALVVGADIGGTNTAIGALDASGQLVSVSRLATNPSQGAMPFIRQLANVIDDILKGRTPQGRVRAIGIACPAVNARLGVVENPANLGWGTVDLASMLREYYDVPIALLNDGDAAAMGEMRFGVARGLSHVVMITLGTGLGGGIIAGGELLQGTNGSGGEIGHIIVAPGGRICACGRMGCAETYVSATGVCRTVAELLAHEIIPSPLRDIPFTELTASRVSDLARDGDQLSRLAFAETGRYLGRLLANLTAVFDPEAIVLSGGLVHAGPLLIEPAVKSFQENVLDRYKKSVRILVSGLNDGHASIFGAATYALQMLADQKIAKQNAVNST